MGKFIKNKKFFFLLIFLGIFAIGSTVLAQTQKKCGELDWPRSPIIGTELKPFWNEAAKKCIYPDLPIMVQYFYEWGITLGGLAAFIALIIAGLQYLTSVGDPSRMKDAMDRVKSALLGLVLLFGSWLILNTINPELTTFRPVALNLSALPTVDAQCNCASTVVCRDCPDASYRCVGDRNQADGKKEGICVPTTGEEPCAYAQVYNKPDYDGTPTRINPNVTVEFAAQSVKSFKAGGKECGPTACGCTLQLFAGGWFLDWGCGDKIGEVTAYDTNLARWVDRPIKCVRLIKPKELQF